MQLKLFLNQSLPYSQLEQVLVSQIYTTLVIALRIYMCHIPHTIESEVRENGMIE